jgi:MULE transposase domain
MPLLHMVGITSSGRSFSIGFCFLLGEKEEDYTWALRCFQAIGIKPKLIVMDGDIALKNASEQV